MQKSRLALRYFREQRREAVRQYAGAHWSEETSREIQPVNMLALYASVMGRNLMAKAPRVLLSTFNRGNKPAVSAMQSWANQQIEDIGLEHTLQRVVLDALFSIGIAKVAIADPADSAVAGWQLGAGTPFCQRVDLDDFVYDLHARAFSEVSFIGHRYRAPKEVIEQSGLYDKKLLKKLAPSTDPIFNLEGDERIGILGRSTYAANTDEFEDFLDLWEIYLPRHGLVLTLADEQMTDGDNVVLREQQWLGPYCGPYHILGYGIIPGNAMPKGSMQDLIDLNEFCNRTFRKLMRQADRQKEILGVAGGAMEDGSRTMEADDGQIIRMDNPEKMKPMTFGAPNPQNFTMFLQAKQLFAYLAGNLDMMGGLSPQSKTLGQDKMLEENASRAVADMQARTIDFTANVLEAMCWYWWHDPFRVMRMTYSLPGLPEMQIQRKVGPEQRQGSFAELEIKVDPYSMQHATPQGRLATLNQVMQQIVLPMMPILQQQGVAVDVNAYLKKVAEYADMPDLAEILTIQEPPAQESGSSEGDKPPMPGETTRNYVRENMPGRTQQGNELNMMNSLMGVDGGGAPERNGEMAMSQ